MRISELQSRPNAIRVCLLHQPLSCSADERFMWPEAKQVINVWTKAFLQLQVNKDRLPLTDNSIIEEVGSRLSKHKRNVTDKIVLISNVWSQQPFQLRFLGALITSPYCLPSRITVKLSGLALTLNCNGLRLCLLVSSLLPSFGKSAILARLLFFLGGTAYSTSPMHQINLSLWLSRVLVFL